VESYNPYNDSWTTETSAITSRGYPAVDAIGGVLYAVGGVSAGRAGAPNEAFNPAKPVTINGSNTTTVLSSSANPSVFGQNVTLTANVTSTGGATPTGSVS